MHTAPSYTAVYHKFYKVIALVYLCFFQLSFPELPRKATYLDNMTLFAATVFIVNHFNCCC